MNHLLGFLVHHGSAVRDLNSVVALFIQAIDHFFRYDNHSANDQPLIDHPHTHTHNAPQGVHTKYSSVCVIANGADMWWWYDCLGHKTSALVGCLYRARQRLLTLQIAQPGYHFIRRSTTYAIAGLSSIWVARWWVDAMRQRALLEAIRMRSSRKWVTNWLLDTTPPIILCQTNVAKQTLVFPSPHTASSRDALTEAVSDVCHDEKRKKPNELC